MDAVLGILVLLMVLSLLTGIVGLIALIVMAIAKKGIKAPGIISGVSFGVFALTAIILVVTSISVDTSNDTYILDEDGNREFEGVEVDGMSDAEIDQTIKEARDSEGIDKSEYEEADLEMVYNNEYEKGTSLKVSDATVFAIEPSDEEYGDDIGNIVYAEVDDIPVILHDPVGRSGIEDGGTYTFYGPPDSSEEIGLILIEFD